MKLLKTLLVSSLAFTATALNATQWEKIKTPVQGKAQSIGGYSNGCIIGAQPLH
ncbi:Penicillin-insensitive murein endopeptidase precursor [Mannheimia haemolytica]|uniref:Penicillin-insensitive murein endopeptidase n=1 Tax=Mannheimia haemolytica TaxID=75985 RepID=A0A378MYN0_MANHA|nr:Penicillin-insensitive murein endopeptidase precursor [Mannheimia haemolytica]